MVEVIPVIQESGSRVISQLSRLRAANGDDRMSAETLEAIKNGAIPPTVIKPEEIIRESDQISADTEDARAAVEETIRIQTESQPEVVGDDVIIALSRAAQVLVDTAPVVPVAETTVQFVDTNIDFTVRENQPQAPETRDEGEAVTSQNIARETNRDTATVALGNTVDIKV